MNRFASVMFTAVLAGSVLLPAVSVASAEELPAVTSDQAVLEVKVKVTADNQVFDAVWYDTPLAREVLEAFPLTVRMSGYLGREYYGSSPLSPKVRPEGQYHFADGEITYCFVNNTIAVFHHQTDRPNLGMEVVPIGRITKNLDAFLAMDRTIDVVFEVQE